MTEHIQVSNEQQCWNNEAVLQRSSVGRKVEDVGLRMDRSVSTFIFYKITVAATFRYEYIYYRSRVRIIFT